MLDPDGKPLQVFRGTLGLRGEQEMKGSADPNTGVADFHFRSAPNGVADEGNVDMEITGAVTRNGDDSSDEDATTLDLSILDSSGKLTSTSQVQIDSQEMALVSFPADKLAGGN